MGAENVFQENEEYLIKARELVVAIDDLQAGLEQAKVIHKKTSKTIAQEEKGLVDEINSTLKNRRNEIEDEYDRLLSENGAKIRQLQAKKDKKKTERMGSRIESETSELNDDNKGLILKIRELFKQNHVPAFCNTGFFYIMFCPSGAGEILSLLLMIAIFCLVIPYICAIGISYVAFDGEMQKLAYVVVILAFVVVEFIIYFIIFNNIKVKNLSTIRKARLLRDKVKTNNKQIRVIRNSITKDKDESVYNLGKYDEKLKELEAEREDIGGRKIEAMKVFDNDTRQVITDEITGRRQPKIDGLKEDLKSYEEKISNMEDELSGMQTHLTDSYVTFLGRDMCTEEKLSDLISIMEEGTASTVSGAIEVYKTES